MPVVACKADTSSTAAGSLEFQADSASVDAAALSEFRHAVWAAAAARAAHGGHEARNGAHWRMPFVRSHWRRDSHALQT